MAGKDMSYDCDSGKFKKNPLTESLRTMRRAVRDDNVCVLTFDRTGSSANIFDRATLAELRQELDFLENASHLKGVIFISAKPAIFIAGLDLKTIGEDASAGEAGTKFI
jgi:enoyl-CoA hydratase/carnithine racemase